MVYQWKGKEIFETGIIFFFQRFYFIFCVAFCSTLLHTHRPGRNCLVCATTVSVYSRTIGINAKIVTIEWDKWSTNNNKNVVNGRFLGFYFVKIFELCILCVCNNFPCSLYEPLTIRFNIMTESNRFTDRDR